MRSILCLITFGICLQAAAQDRPQVLSGTVPLTIDRPLDLVMVEGIDQFCLKEIDKARIERESQWKRDYSSSEAYEKSLQTYRETFRTIIGAVDARITGATINSIIAPFPKLAGPHPISWPVLPGMTADGIAIVPHGEPKGIVIAIPDSRWNPDTVWGGTEPISDLPEAFVRAGYLVIVPMLINRNNEFSGNPEVAMTNQSHREWVYRSAFELGRHVLGYEVQKIFSAIDLAQGVCKATSRKPSLSTIVCGLGDGAQLAMYTAALDTRVNAVLVSGYFQPRDGVCKSRLITTSGNS